MVISSETKTPSVLDMFSDFNIYFRQAIPSTDPENSKGPKGLDDYLESLQNNVLSSDPVY